MNGDKFINTHTTKLPELTYRNNKNYKIIKNYKKLTFKREKTEKL